LPFFQQPAKNSLSYDMNNSSICVNLGSRSYPIVIGRNTLSHDLARHPLIAKSKGRIFVIADPKVRRHAAPVIRALKKRTSGIVWLKGGERSKQISTLNSLYKAAARARLDRHSLVVAMGGGVIGDIAGVFAATYLRGLSIVHLPTTVMAQVDSSIGGKTGINLLEGKNLVGVFHQPALVYIDAETLKTLPDREFKSGLAEVIKYGVISDPELFERLEKNLSKILFRDPAELAWIIRRCCAIKARVVSRDEHETKGLRAILNFGHTIGHGIEAAARYHLLHGEAIAIGMMGATYLSQKLTKLSSISVQRIGRLIQNTGLPFQLDKKLSTREILAAMKLDKKVSQGEIRFVLATRIGQVKTGLGVSERLIREALDFLRK